MVGPHTTRENELHRRAQSAEAALVLALAPHQGGPPFGRALANAAATMYHGQLADLVRAAGRLLLTHGCSLADEDPQCVDCRDVRAAIAAAEVRR